MAVKIIMPAGGQTSDTAVLQKWRKAVGDTVEAGEVLFEIETDKAVLEIESYAAGTLLKRCYPEGAEVPVQAVVGWVGRPGESVPDGDAPPDAAADDDEYQPIAGPGEADPLPAASGGSRVLASPAARKLAKRHGIDLTGLGQPVKLAQVAELVNGAAEFEEVPVSGMRRTIAARMLESVAAIPAFQAEIAVDMGRAAVLRRTLRERCEISYNDLIMAAACRAIAEYPMVNASWRGETIRVYRQVHFGLAVGVEKGLTVAVVRDAGNLSLPELARANRENIARAKAGGDLSRLMAGGTITLSNLGGFGIRRFTAIINPPEACILAVGAIGPDHLMSVTGSFDHRIIDGAAAAGFLAALRQQLENPELLLL